MDACLAINERVRSIPQQGHDQSLPKLRKCEQPSLAFPQHLIQHISFLSFGPSFQCMVVSLCPDSPAHGGEGPLSNVTTSEWAYHCHAPSPTTLRQFLLH